MPLVEQATTPGALNDDAAQALAAEPGSKTDRLRAAATAHDRAVAE